MNGPGTPSATPPRTLIRSAPSPTCVACGSAGASLYEGLTDYLAGTPGSWRMVRCARESCGLLWLDPKPLAADLIKAYASYHTHGRRSRSAAELGLSALNTACKLASRAVDLTSGLARQRRALRMMYLGDAKPGRLLEVGSGAGRFLHRMHRAGWRVQGTDFDPAVAERVRRRYGLSVDIGSLTDLCYPAESYDAVAMSQTLEHLHDPLAQLEECRRVLRPGGRLVLTTPNALARAHQLYGRRWRGLEPPRHLHIFTPAALEHCARACGFEVLRLETLSAESAGIYRASAASGAESARVLRSWCLRQAEHRENRRRPGVGQDILLVGAKPA
ncbi:MAG TPA: class I SAM-dependent methyltransferase [Burkholderiales bacterium]|nr:class I SAM-dependent methyltransferase [Burkholderiales bacterium]